MKLLHLCCGGNFEVVKKMFVMFISILLIFSSIVLTWANDESDEEESIDIKSATEYDYPPFSVTSEGVADGFSVELLSAVMKEIGYSIEYRIDTWQEIKEDLKNGDLDVLPLVGYSEERDKYFDFTVPYLVMQGNIFVREEDKESFQSEDDLHGKSILVMEGDNAHEYATTMEWSTDLILVPTYAEAFKLLSEGKYDVVIAQSLVGEITINNLDLKNVVPAYSNDKVTGEKIKTQLSGFEQKFCFAVKEGNSDLLAKLNEGLAIVSANGTYDQIYNKWFPFLIDGASITDILIWVFVILVPILIIMLLIALKIIRYQVREKTEALKKENEKIKYMSFHDTLTGLYNRRFYEIELKRLDNKENYPLAIVVADANGLKLINDTFGHHAGDDMIKNTANLLRKVCGATDIVARWGGDEFVLVLPNSSKSKVVNSLDMLNDLSLEKKYEFGHLSLSFGYDIKYEEGKSIVEVFKTAEEDMYKNKARLSKGYRADMIDIMKKSLFNKSPHEREHSKNVCELAIKLAHELKLDPVRISDISKISTLHDIGKISLSQIILDKNDKLDSEQWEEVKQHPIIGYRILSTSGEYSHLAKVVLHHHERIDGTGYPDGLKGEYIPLESKLLSVVDAYDEMTTKNVYSEVLLDKNEAAKELKNNINTQFDEEIVRAFVIGVLDLEWEKL